jgi:hypothetical protein
MATQTKQSKTSQAGGDAKTTPNIGDIMNALEEAINKTQLLYGDIVLTTAERRRLNGAGVRRYGLIDKTMDYASEFTMFAPQAFNLQRLAKAKENIEFLRDAQVLCDQLSRLLSDALLVNGETAYNEALLYYTALRELARRNVPGASELFERLRLLFKRKKSEGSPETEAELLRDARKLIEGKADGEMIIKNVKPHSEGGVHEVVDEMGKVRAEREIKIENK